MGRDMLVDGEWKTDIEPYTDDDGAFDRAETSFRDWIRNKEDARFQPEADRYHLYIARNCPWAHGTALTRQLADLTDIISIDIVDPWREDDGWEFTPEKDGCTPDTVNGYEYLRDVYIKADPAYTGRVTVPVLWDKQEETIVNNESIEIMRMLATAFHEYGDGIDLYHEGYQDEIDRIIESIYDSINNQTAEIKKWYELMIGISEKVKVQADNLSKLEKSLETHVQRTDSRFDDHNQRIRSIEFELIPRRINRLKSPTSKDTTDAQNTNSDN